VVHLQFFTRTIYSGQCIIIIEDRTVREYESAVYDTKSIIWQR